MWKKNDIALIFSNDLSLYNYGKSHPMKPERISMTYDLLNGYNILSSFSIYNSFLCPEEDLKSFHDPNYLNFMKNYNNFSPEEKKDNFYNIGTEDVPAFKGFYNFSKLVAGSSLIGAELLASKKKNLVLNWIGGLHHAKESRASGFCYINDCVLAIKRLLYDFKKVLYIDMDVHHGDGVEEAFLYTNRVVTLSFHEFGEGFFPGTGGFVEFKKDNFSHSFNVPIKKGCSDFSYEFFFEKTVDRIFEVYQPDAVVIQCGADSIIGDKLGHFNVSLKGHGKAFKHVISKNLPTLCLGGGGYTKENVSRLWCYESSIVLDYEIPEFIPEDIYFKNNYTDDLFFYEPKNYHNLKKDYNSEKYKYTVLQNIFDKCNLLFNYNSIPIIEKPELNLTLTSIIEKYNENYFESYEEDKKNEKEIEFIF